jgi:lipopolysaccharide heptosyltransferase II
MLKFRKKQTQIPRIDAGLDLRGDLRVLVLRPDRLGDVILSTPVFEVIKHHYPNAHQTIFVKDHVAPVLKGLKSVDELITFDPEGRHAGVKGFFRLCKEFRKGNYRIAIILQSHWKVAAALFLARVRYRVGPLSKIHSFLFYNRGLRQRRSHVEMHETDYNLQLLRRLGIRVGSRTVPPRVHISQDARHAAQKWLDENGRDREKRLILVHPGMGGSALNWPETHYYELIRTLIHDGCQVLITGGPTEGELLARIENAIGVFRQGAIFYRSSRTSSIDFLGALCAQAELVVAPSTGPLHLAVAVGKPVITFYPPIRVQSALRWGPYLPDESRASVLVPEVYCGQDFECLGHLCNYFPCMKSLTVKQTLTQVHRHLESSKKASNEPEPLNQEAETHALS